MDARRPEQPPHRPPEPTRGNAMRNILKTLIVALALFVASPAFAPAAQAAMAVQAAAATSATSPSLTDPASTDPASTGPVNPGTGETGGAEATRLDYAPLVIGAVALITLVVILIWRRRRNKTIV
jgi:hypothetical protein